MSLELGCRSLSRSRLESLQLSGTLEVPCSLNRLFQEVDVGVPLRSLCPDSLIDNMIPLQMLRGAVEPVLEVHLCYIVRMAQGGRYGRS